MSALRLPSPLERLKWSRLEGLELWVKRDDLIHPVISGNKWRKLQGLFEDWRAEPPSLIVSFGGAYSHHLSALALCLEQRGWPGLFVVRGEELNEGSNLTLRYCAERGVRLQFVTRERYRQLRARGWLLSLQERVEWGLPEGILSLPEGGDAVSAERGCRAIWAELESQRSRHEALDELWLCAGTGATARGLMMGMPYGCETKLVIISAVKGAHAQAQQTLAVAQARGLRCEWLDELRFGGFGRRTDALMRLRAEGIEETGVWVDPIYQPKLWWELLERRALLRGKRVVWLHTGGAQALCEASSWELSDPQRGGGA